MNSGLLYVLITAVLFATLEPVSGEIAGDFTPTAITSIRFLIAGFMLLPFGLREMKKRDLKLSIKDHLKIFGLGILFVCASMVMLQYAIKLASMQSTGKTALIAIVFSINSVITVFLSSIILKDRITAKKILALILCIAGIMTCSWTELSSSVGLFPIALAFMAALTFSIYTILNKKMLVKATGNMLFSLASIYGGVVLLIANQFIFGEIVTTPNLSTSSIWILVYVGVAVTGIGYWGYFQALEKGSAVLASLSFFVKPALSPFVAVLVAYTKGATTSGIITIATIVGLILVLAGSYLVSFAGKKIFNK